MDNSLMPKPTVQNAPKPEPKALARDRRPKPQRVAIADGAELPRQTAHDRAACIDVLLPLLESGDTLHEACAKVEGGPAPHTVLRWTREDAAFSEQYSRARELGYLVLADKIMKTANEPVPTMDSGATDSGYVADKRLRVDTQKWLLSKALPKIYGDKVTQEHVGKDGGPIQTATVDLRGLSEEELAQMEALMSKASGAGK